MHFLHDQVQSLREAASVVIILCMPHSIHCLWRSLSSIRDAVLLDLVLQGSERNTQQFSRSLPVAPCPCQCTLNGGALQGPQVAGPLSRLIRSGPRFLERWDRKGVSLAHDERPLEDVLEFPDVAGPGIGEHVP